jgi:hypothetical protein
MNLSQNPLGAVARKSLIFGPVCTWLFVSQKEILLGFFFGKKGRVDDDSVDHSAGDPRRRLRRISVDTFGSIKKTWAQTR